MNKTSCKTFFFGMIFCASMLFISCDESKSSINKKKDKRDFPSQILRNARIIQRDSGQIKLRADAPLLEKFELVDTPYVVARKGIKIEYYEPKNGKEPGKISANFAKFIELKKMYEARGNVRIITQEGQTFLMNSVFWNQDKKIIYTNDTVFVTDKDGSTLVATQGMEAKDDFSEYSFHNTQGSISTEKVPN